VERGRGGEGLRVLRIGSQEQPVLAKKGDNLRIDWGHLTVAAPDGPGVATAVLTHQMARRGFTDRVPLPAEDDTNMPRPASEDWPVTACTFDLGKVGKEPLSRWLMLAYDDEWSIEYLGQKLRPWWRRGGAEASDLLTVAAKQREELTARCEAFDRELMADLERVGGPGYADLCALAYRQAIGAHKLVASPDGRPMFFSKECFSNGCISTVDVTYPAAPLFMLLSNDLLKASTTPVLDYAATPRWRFPFAPHDLGTYPQANGQVYGGGERTAENQMPVEESGNLLIVAAVIAQLDGNTTYVQRYWPPLQQWARYLKDKGLDPENQLCTDDFAGHLAHNANLSLKAILALGAYAKMCAMAGKKEEAADYRRTAEAFAREWVKLADDGDHYRLAFDKPGTWSQKYNLVWDKLLGLGLFPPEVARKEVAFYKTKLNRFGLPLDNRETYTKTDWQVWTATLAESREDFDALMQPVYGFVAATPDRVPLTDWYMTKDAKLRGFRARPVIGGVFIKMLSDAEVWKKWAKRGEGRGTRGEGKKEAAGADSQSAIGNWQSAIPISSALGTPSSERWTAEQARAWYERQPWLVGFNFLPSTAVNDTEMWARETFDAATIARELGWAKAAGYNSCRVFLQYIVWRDDPAGFKARFEQFLASAGKHGLSVVPTFFDDCAFAGKEPYPGKQDDPVPGVHNSGWVPSPGHKIIADPAQWGGPEKFLKDVMAAFAKDRRIVFWDLYNEPSRSLPFVEAVFQWARQVNPSQPITTCIFGPPEMAKRIPELSDLITFHNYNDLASVKAEVARLKQAYGRPVVCTEWMARGAGSRFASHLPLFKQEKVGCYNWGLVAGRTQTYYPWGSPKGAPEPKLWHHDVFRKDGTPYDPAEILALRRYTLNLQVKVLVPTAQEQGIAWRYTREKPADDWMKPDFDDSRWPQGEAPFGTLEPEHGRHPRTAWKTPDLWLRRTFDLGTDRIAEPLVRLHHDEDAEVYLNGVLAATATGYTACYVEVPLTAAGKAALKAGRNTLAVHCRQTVGGQYIDVGLVELR
jgi:hypothetical protein